MIYPLNHTACDYMLSSNDVIEGFPCMHAFGRHPPSFVQNPAAVDSRG